MNTNWQEFKYSKTAAIKSVKQLIKNDLSLEEKYKCLEIVANFRSSHSYPMQSMLGHFRKKAFEVDKNAILVRRLKRIPSIVNKLKRFPTMQITTMGDIGGIRIITKNFQNVNEIYNRLIESRTRNTLLSKKNYLENPKDSGYRSIHLTYSYQGAQRAYEGFRVELQIRSQIQHAWATAVEVVGTFSGENLKASLGDEQWLEFFKLVSRVFDSFEKGEKIDPDHQKLIESKIKELGVITRLTSFTALTVQLPDEKEGFYLLRLDTKNKRIFAQYFKPAFLQEAHEDYRREEQEISDDPTRDVVLVSVASLKDLKKAYPNYFADTTLFLRILNQVRDKK